MRKMVRFGVAVCAALTFCAMVASSASALQAIDGVTNTALATGSTVTAAAGTSTLTGSFFGIGNTTITCSNSYLSGTVKANASTGGNVWGSIDTLTWTGCVKNATTSCTVTAVGLPWDPSTANGGGLEVTAGSGTANNVAIGPGASASNYIDLTNCAGITCHLWGGTATARTDTSGTTNFSLPNYLTATFTNNATGNQLSISSSNIGSNGCVTSAQWQAAYRLTDSAGNAVALNTT